MADTSLPGQASEKQPGSTLRGRIVSAYRSADSTVLQLNLGSADGVEAGMTGAILSGASGDARLDGGDFEIVQVFGPNKSVARSSVKSIGRNIRVEINLRKS
jgi:hypothetical protein